MKSTKIKVILAEVKTELAEIRADRLAEVKKELAMTIRAAEVKIDRLARVKEELATIVMDNAAWMFEEKLDEIKEKLVAIKAGEWC